MNIFNKKKIQNLEKEISLLKKEIEVKDNALKNYNTKVIDNLNKQIEDSNKRNKELSDWLLELIKHNGFKIPEQIPYFKMERCEPLLKPSSNGCMQLRVERYMIPSIEITEWR